MCYLSHFFSYEQVGAEDDIRVQSHSGRTPLYAACEGGGAQAAEVADWLCQMGAGDDVRTCDENGQTPMHAACREVSTSFFTNKNSLPSVIRLEFY
jgi:ankyrin repeat protein